MQGREQGQRLTDAEAVGQGGVLELGADPEPQAVAVDRGIEAEDLRLP